MQDQLYEITVEKNHLSIIIKALSNYICSQYEGIDAELVDVPKTMENIKIAADMQLVLKHHLGGVQHSPKQRAETTGLVWIKEVFALQEDIEPLDQEPFEPFSDENLQDKVFERNLKFLKQQGVRCEDECAPLTQEQIDYLLGRVKSSWNNVKERHKGTLQRMSNK